MQSQTQVSPQIQKSQDQSIELSCDIIVKQSESATVDNSFHQQPFQQEEDSEDASSFGSGYKPPIQYGETTGFVKPSIKEQKEAKLTEELRKIDDELQNGWYSYYSFGLYLMIANSIFLMLIGVGYLQDYSFVLYGAFAVVAACFVLSSIKNKNSTKAYYGLILGVIGIVLLIRALYATYHHMGAADDRKKFNNFVFRVLVASFLYIFGHVYAPYKVKTLMQKREVFSKEIQANDSILSI